MVVVAADGSSQSWQEKADFHCRGEPDDAVVLRAAGEAAVERKEQLIVAPGYYGVESCFEVSADIRGVVSAGQVYLLPRGEYAGWLMKMQGPGKFAKIEGLGFMGKQQAKGLLVDNSHQCIIERLHFSGTTQALKVERGWTTYLRAIKVGDCHNGGTDPLVEIGQFSASSLRGLVIDRCSAKAPMLSIHGKATCEDFAIEKCTSVDAPIIRFSGKQSSLSRLHFEDNKAPVQVEAVDCRQCDLSGFGFAGPASIPVNVGVLLTRCRDTVVDGVIVTYCTDALVRLDAESARPESRCKAKRVDLYFDHDRYKNIPELSPKHLIDYAGPGSK